MRKAARELIWLSCLLASGLIGFAPAYGNPALGGFSLPRLLGDAVTPPGILRDQTLTYSAASGQGALLLTVTDINCKSCQDAVIDLHDHGAVARAHEAGVPAWNVLVHANAHSGRKFFDHFHPAADQYLLDDKAEYFSGDDRHCWILLDRSGRLAWRGGRDQGRLKRALAALNR